MPMVKLVFNIRLAWTILLIGLLGCASNPAENADLSSETEIVAATKLIEACPNWAQIRKSDGGERNRIIPILEEVNHYPSVTLRRAMERFQNSTNCGLDGMATLFLINRYIFNVPQWVLTNDATQFGGWFGIPEANGKVDMLFPLEAAPSGKLKLTGAHIGYMGAPFQALNEFDWFKRRFGRRRQMELDGRGM
jgi:hypothetical protein